MFEEWDCLEEPAGSCRESLEDLDKVRGVGEGLRGEEWPGHPRRGQGI